MDLMTIAVFGLLAATVFSLIGGVSTMATGHEIRHHSGEQWMILRIGFQALAVVFLLVAFWLK